MATQPRSPQLSVQPKPFQIRGTGFNLLTLQLADPDDNNFFEALATTLSLAPGFYRAAPLVLDFSGVGRRLPINLSVFCQRLRDLALVPIGFVGATADWEAAAVQAGLSVFPAGRATDAGSVRGRAAAAKRQETRIVTQPVRSGQRLYAAEGDLVVISTVSHGAELLADGNIHVYGPLRGRALAGMGGDATTRIFCRRLEADLVSIAGVYLVSDQFDPTVIGQSVQIRLEGENLVFESL